jgi:phosphopantothenoylcysteine decarboxylase/phosphopantothenate--cysteine ligase
MAKGKLAFIVTAGPTREHLDPVRFLSNPSTGKMGFAIAAEASRRGARTVLVAGPVALKTPKGVCRTDVVSARDMMRAVKEARKALAGHEIVLVATAAVADWRPKNCAAGKLKKTSMAPCIPLVRNPDILKETKGVRKVGFAAETGKLLEEAARKCAEKGLEFIVANDVTVPGAGFGVDTNLASLVFPDGRVETLELMTKKKLAKRIVDEVFRS